MTSGGFWPGEQPADEDRQESEQAAVAEPPSWPQPRLETEGPESEPEDEPEDEPDEPDEDEEPEPEPEPAAAAVAAQEPAVVEEEAEEAEEIEEEPEPEPQPRAHVPGELDIPDDVAALEGSPSGSDRTVGVVVSRFNGEISNKLLASALGALAAAGVPEERVTVMPVPGAFELPIGAMALAKTRRYSCVVALGCVVRGETAHFEYVAGEAASGLQLAGLETGVPVAFGVLTVDTEQQALARIDKGAEAVRAALEMADLFAQLRARAKAS